jgi:hypothetical protein
MAVERNESEPENEIVFVESDFLFGLRKSDVRHSHVMQALNIHKQDKMNIQILSSAVFEVRTVLASRGLVPKLIEDLLSLMAALLADYGVNNFTPLEFGDLILAERMRFQWPDLSFFDSMHAATSKSRKRRLLTSEGIYEKIGLDVIDLDAI